MLSIWAERGKKKHAEDDYKFIFRCTPLVNVSGTSQLVLRKKVSAGAMKHFIPRDMCREKRKILKPKEIEKH